MCKGGPKWNSPEMKGQRVVTIEIFCLVVSILLLILIVKAAKAAFRKLDAIK